MTNVAAEPQHSQLKVMYETIVVDNSRADNISEGDLSTFVRITSQSGCRWA